MSEWWNAGCWASRLAGRNYSSASVRDKEAWPRSSAFPSMRLGAHAGILEQIQAGIPALLEKADLNINQVAAIGIGFGGPVDHVRGRTQKSYQVSGWDDFPLCAWIQKHWPVSVVVLENDADSAGLAESRFGAGVGMSPLVYMTVGSGIGGALLIDDRIYRGFGQGAAEIGHLCVPDFSSSEARWLELEQVASGWGIAAAAQSLALQMLADGRDRWRVLEAARGRPSEITAAIVAEAALLGDADATSILDRARAAVAFALTQVIALVAPRRIVIGGGVSLIGEKAWFDPIRRMIDVDVFPQFAGRFDIVPAILGEEVVVHGALALARDAVAD